MMTTKWVTDQSAIRTWPCMNIVIFTHNIGNWLIVHLRIGLIGRIGAWAWNHRGSTESKIVKPPQSLPLQMAERLIELS